MADLPALLAEAERVEAAVKVGRVEMSGTIGAVTAVNDMRRSHTALLAAIRTPPSDEWAGVMYEGLDIEDRGIDSAARFAASHNACVTALRAKVEAERERTRRVVEAAVAMIGDPDVMAWGDAGTAEAESTEVPQARWVALVDAVRALRGEP